MPALPGRHALALILVSAVCSALPAAAEEPAYAEAGVTLIPPAGTTLSCSALIAHWYRLDFPPDADGTIHIPLRYDATSETVSVLNDVGDEMAVEHLFCAEPGTDWQQATTMDYRTIAKDAAEQGPLTLACRKTESGISCVQAP